MSSIQRKQEITDKENLVGRKLCDGEYHIQRILGHGGMGKVYLASHTALTTPLALKQARADQPLPESTVAELDYLLTGKDTAHSSRGEETQEYDFPSSGGAHTDRFLREALLLARLHHPAIPTLYDYFFEDGYWYLVMDYIPGTTLASYLRRHAPLPPLEALNYTMQLCDVLDYLHSQSPPIIFRDLKPSNIILMPDGTLMLVDFGIARYFKEGQVNDTTDFGSPGYASPEQYQGTAQTDGRSDLFSLGIILREMITGKHPTGLEASLASPRYINPDTSVILSGLITLATRLEPTYRFQSAHAFYLALERAYHIEEQRLYQRFIHKTGEAGQALQVLTAEEAGKAERIGETEEAEPQQEFPLQQDVIVGETSNAPGTPDHTMPTAQLPSRTLEQRYQIRETIHQARQKRLAEQNLEIQLAAVDDSLKRRALKALAPTGQLSEEGPKRSTQQPRSLHTFHRIIQASFTIGLLLTFVTASLLIYVHHPTNRASNISQKQVMHSVPTDTVMAKSHWQVLPSLPSTEADNTLIYVQVQGRAYLYMSGSFRGQTHVPNYDRNLYRYDIASAHWETLIDEHFPGMVNNAVAADGQGHLFFTAGYSPDTHTIPSILYMYQTADGELRKITAPAQMSIGFGDAMFADQQGHIYITQGFIKAGDPNALAGTGWYRYDIATEQWHLLAPLPQGLGYTMLTADHSGDLLLLAGAMDAGQHHQTDRVYRYHIAKNTWTQEQATAPLPLSGVASCQMRPEQMIVMGGYDPIHSRGLNQAWLVDLRTLHWTSLAATPFGGSVLGAAACDKMGHVFIERGANDPHLPTQDFWEWS